MIELLEKTAKEASKFFQNFLVIESTANRNGFLQKVDARVKVLGIFVLVVLSVSTFDFQKLFFSLMLIPILLAISKISLKVFVSRVWLFPLFSFLIVSPRIFMGKVLLYPSLFLTYDGLIYSIIFTLRVFIAVSFLSLLILTTQFSEIISALRFFKIPESIISILVLTYRYIHLTFSELFRILVARESRRVRKMKISEIWNGGGASLGVFFIRVLERAERIYLSSIARGGQNYRPYVFPLRFRSTEAFFTSMVLANIIWWLI